MTIERTHDHALMPRVHSKIPKFSSLKLNAHLPLKHITAAVGSSEPHQHNHPPILSQRITRHCDFCMRKALWVRKWRRRLRFIMVVTGFLHEKSIFFIGCCVRMNRAPLNPLQLCRRVLCGSHASRSCLGGEKAAVFVMVAHCVVQRKLSGELISISE